MRIALAIGFCLIATSTFASSATSAADKPAKPTPQAPATVRAVQKPPAPTVVTIIAGGSGTTDLRIAGDIAEILERDGDLRVLPIAGKGASQNVKDVMSLPGVDLAMTQANVLRYYARTGELGSDFADRITYVSKLFNEEIHLLVRPEIASITDLEGKKVNLGEIGSGTEITGHQLLDALQVHAEELHLSDAEAIAKLKSGSIDAAVLVSAKPMPALAGEGAGLKLLPVPYDKSLENDYYPATLTHADYPELIAEGESIDSVAVCAVLVALDPGKSAARARKDAKFVNAFFDRFDTFLAPPNHPKWREVNFAATLEGWHRAPAAQAWIDRATQTAEQERKQSFDAFISKTAAATGKPVSDDERAELFKAFLEWSKRQPAIQ